MWDSFRPAANESVNVKRYDWSIGPEVVALDYEDAVTHFINVNVPEIINEIHRKLLNHFINQELVRLAWKRLIAKYCDSL